MKRLVVILILFLSARLAASGFDDMVLWRYELPASSQNSFSLEPLNLSQDGFKAALLHADPYRISSLHWNYAAFKYGLTKWGIFGGARFYGLNNLYSNDQITLGGAFRPHPNFALAVSINNERELFQEIDSYNRIDLDAKISGSISGFTGGLDIDRINLSKSYDGPGIITPEPMIYGSLRFDENYQLSIGAKRLYAKRARWFFNQDANIINGIGLRLGYFSNPNVLNWGLDLNWKSFTFEFTYFAMSRLNDTMALGLTIAM
jgi:hypothetical protein